ncbi:MAG: class I SAM-dependent methyltransferase [Caldimonas sp.]
MTPSYYAERAAEYDRVYDKPERQDDLRALKRRLPPLFSGTRLIEVACGTGYWTQFIAPGAREVVALDAAPETLAIARGRVGANVELLVGDAYDLPSDRGLFDAAFAGFWFSHVARRRRREFLEGLGRVLVPSAQVVLLDNRYVEGSSLPIAERDAEGDTWQTRTLSDGSVHRVLKNFPTETELRELVAGLGESAVIENFEYYWVFRYAAAPLA